MFNLSKLKKVAIVERSDVNYMLLPVTRLTLNKDNIEYYNSLIDELKSEDAYKIVRTKSGGICVKKDKFHYFAFDSRTSGIGFELTVVSGYGSFRLQLGNFNTEEKTSTVTGSKALLSFKKLLKKMSKLDLDDYIVDKQTGLAIKEQIHKPLISVECETDVWYENVSHIDFNSFYPSGLVISHPEFRPVIQYMYEKRKENSGYYKLVLNSLIGKMQSQQIGYRYANLAKDAINTAVYELLYPLTEKLIASGRKILGFNVDGIFYQGDVYEDENVGKDLCQYKNDYTNCRIRFKSAGAYQFWYNDELYTKLRGKTKLDSIKPRDKDGLGWDESDLYSKDAVAIKYSLSKDKIKIIEGGEWYEQ